MSWNEVFFKILKKKTPFAEINDTSYESQAHFHWHVTKNFFEKPKMEDWIFIGGTGK